LTVNRRASANEDDVAIERKAAVRRKVLFIGAEIILAILTIITIATAVPPLSGAKRLE
jgi:hypothetical protein